MALQDVILDPSEVAVAGRREITLGGSEGVTVYHEGIDWGTQEVKQFMAEGLFGSRPIDSEWPLRSIKLPLVIRPTETATFDDVRVMLEQWVAQANLEGAWVKRVLPSGRVIFADIVEAKLHLAASWHAENIDFDNESFLELQALPDCYGDVVTGTPHEFTGDGAFTEDIGGDMPARVEQMLVEDKSGNAQSGLMFHYRRRNFSSANTAEWAYNAETLGLLDIAEKVANPSGVAYGSKVVKHPKLSTGWTPLLSTNKGGSTFLTHTGLYTIWARVYATSESLPWLRLVYGVGDVVAPQTNTQVQVPGKAGWFWVSLGQVNIRALPFGAQRWEGVIQARTEGSGVSEAVYIDRIRLKCDDECSGTLGAIRGASSLALSAVAASDPLVSRSTKGEAETLNGTEATRGGQWEDAASGTGFKRGPGKEPAIEPEGAWRKTKSDAEGRTALLATPFTGPLLVKLTTGLDSLQVGLTQGFYLRYKSSTEWIRVVEVISSHLGIKQTGLAVEYNSGSGVKFVTLASAVNPLESFEAELNGAVVTVFYGETRYFTTLPSTLTEGKIGVYDFNPSAVEVIRTYRSLAALVPGTDAVIFGNKSAYLSTQGMYRQSEDGLGAAPIGYPGADLPRLPVGEVEIAVAPSRGQFAELPDAGKDKFKVQMSYRECFAEIPSS